MADIAHSTRSHAPITVEDSNVTDIKYPAPPDNFPNKGSNASGTCLAYSVEARVASYEPRVIGGNLMDTRWRRVSMDIAKAGVPVRGLTLFPVFPTLGLLPYQAAQALRWWFLAQAEAEFSCLCVETRLVEHKVEYSYSETSERACSVIGEGESRSNIIA